MYSTVCYLVLFGWTMALVNSESMVVRLFNRIKEAQILHSSNLSTFPPTWELKKGMYPNVVKLNFHGDEQYYLFRDEFKVPDNNMFTPAWVTMSLIEAFIYGNGPKPTTDQVSSALHAIDAFRNQNVPYANSEMTFWEQKMNTTARYFQSSPDNLFEILRLPDYLPQKSIEEILRILGLKDLAGVLEKLFREKDIFAQAFHIPPDFDDAFVNIGLGSLLKMSHDQFSTGFQTWSKQNTNLTSVFEKVKKYAYRPFSRDASKSTIDPRTYMYLRTFLNKASTNQADVALITTWLQDTQEVISLFDKGVAMPFNVNNVDVTVSANFLFGMVTCVLSGVCTEYVDDDVQGIFFRPFSRDASKSTIDPRTYMYLRTFLNKASTNQADVALITTWLQDTQEVISLFDKGVAMPFNVNNVDVTVSANFLFGMVTCVLSGVCTEYVDDDVQQIFMNTTAMIAHELSSNLSSRPDLALTYYPSKYEFYWFVSRSYSHLNRMHSSSGGKHNSSDLDQILKYAFGVLRPVLRQQMSVDITSAAKTDSDGSMYIDNFLGNNDVNLLNKTVNRAEDRIFTTAVSVNALINTWTLKQDNRLVWENDTPDGVRNTVKKFAEWLDKNTLSSSYKPWNSFFSGSGKGLKSMPFFYPANRREFFNGTTFLDKKFPATAKNIIGMEGYVTEQEYSAMLKMPHFGQMTPMTFDGYNSEAGGFFPFWSCDSYTYAVSMLALAQYENISN